MIFTPQSEPKISRGSTQLQVLEGIDLTLSAEEVFGWLKVLERKRTVD
ncbi:MAG: hypothetical protein WBA39_02000 [Rivularia sp. (in: cyanobacteria)]